MQGDTLKGKQKDWFRFDKGRRGLPRKQDGVTPREEIEATCEKMCVEKHGYFLFRAKYHVELFNRGDWFHVSFLSSPFPTIFNFPSLCRLRPFWSRVFFLVRRMTDWGNAAF